MSTYQADWFLDESGNFDGRAAAVSMGLSVRSERAVGEDADDNADDSDEDNDGETLLVLLLLLLLLSL